MASTAGWIWWLFSLISRQFHHEVRARKAVLLRGPRAQVSQLAAFGTERSPGITLPGGWLRAERAGHADILSR
jgi:hypothetical protein